MRKIRSWQGYKRRRGEGLNALLRSCRQELTKQLDQLRSKIPEITQFHLGGRSKICMHARALSRGHLSQPCSQPGATALLLEGELSVLDACSLRCLYCSPTHLNDALHSLLNNLVKEGLAACGLLSRGHVCMYVLLRAYAHGGSGGGVPMNEGGDYVSYKVERVR